MLNLDYKKGIEACIKCATECNHCAVSCLKENDVQRLTKCIRLNLECAVVCRVTAELISLHSRYTKEICQLCASICNACAEECERHSNDGLEYCKECAETCRACAKEVIEISQLLLKQESDTNKTIPQFVKQEECAVINRAAAELISLESGYAKEISTLNTAICDAIAEEFEKHAKMGMAHCHKCAAVANEAQKDLADQDEKGNKKDADQKKKKHSSALLAASMYRSPVNAVSSHSYLSGGIDSTGIWSEFQ